LPLAVRAPAGRGRNEFSWDPRFQQMGSAFKTAVRAEDALDGPCHPF